MQVNDSQTFKNRQTTEEQNVSFYTDP